MEIQLHIDAKKKRAMEEFQITKSGLLHYWGPCTCIPSTVSRNGSTTITLGSIRQAVLSNKYGGRDILYNTDAINHIAKLIVHCPVGKLV